MIRLELSGSDLEKLVRIGRELSGVEELDKLSNFRLLPGNRVAFDQRFYLPTTIRLELSRDDCGNLLIAFPRLADNSVGNFFLQLLVRLLEKLLPDKFVSDKSNGILKKISDKQILLNLGKCFPAGEKIKIKNVGTSDGKLSLDMDLE